MKIGDFCSYAPKSQIKAGEAKENAKYMFFTSSMEVDKKYDDYQIDGEGIIMGTGGRATIHYYSGKFSTSTDCVVLQTNSKIRCKYLYYFLKANINILEAGFKGAGLKHTNKAYISGIKIDRIPPFNHQDKVIEALDLLQNVIRNREMELDRLNELIKARFVEMFGDPKINDKKWKNGIVADYFEVKGGKRIPKGMEYSKEITNHPYLRTTDMKNETIIDKDIHFVGDDIYQKLKNYTVRGGDIYLTNVGANLGMAGIIPEKYSGAILTENAVKLIPKNNEFQGPFIAHYINASGIQDYINERKMSVGVPKLAIFRIETMPLIIPPIKEQEKFTKFCDQINKSKVAIQKALDQAQTLFDSLMQEYFG